jgi:5'-deoxynucleotidase YfbR-like HD superfamily hydrolase
MLLIHDLGEIDAGDTIIYASETKELKKKEEEGIRRILDILPEGKTDEYLNSRIAKGSNELWDVLKNKLNKAIDDGILN